MRVPQSLIVDVDENDELTVERIEKKAEFN